MAATTSTKKDDHVKGNSGQVDFEKYPTAKELLSACQEFFDEIQNLTPGKDLEKRLNAEHGPGTKHFDTFAAYIHKGVQEGWVANEQITGPEYRRSRIAQPCADTRFLSISAVYMESPKSGATTTFADHDHDDHDHDAPDIKGQYHKHPYGEINMVLPVDPEAKLMGMQGWQGAGWTSPGPGTHHYPQVKGGGLISFFFLPAGRITYDASPDEPQPVCV